MRFITYSLYYQPLLTYENLFYLVFLLTIHIIKAYMCSTLETEEWKIKFTNYLIS